MSSNKYCVIMAGGIGTRFWPKSRQSMPKQFLDILGTGKSFIRHTYERFAKMVPAENFLVVTNDKYKSLVLEHIPEIGEKQVLCEPVGRNTAPCVAYAAYTLLKRNPDAEMIVTPADHLILNEDDFRAIIAECLDFASEHDALMTVGIKPTRPDTGYGYIQVSDDKPISKVKCCLLYTSRSPPPPAVPTRQERHPARCLPTPCGHGPSEKPVHTRVHSDRGIVAENTPNGFPQFSQNMSEYSESFKYSDNSGNCKIWTAANYLRLRVDSTPQGILSPLRGAQAQKRQDRSCGSCL